MRTIVGWARTGTSTITLVDTLIGKMIHDSVFLDQPFRRWLDLFRWSLPHRSYGTTYLGDEGSNVEWLLIYSNTCTMNQGKQTWIAFRGIGRINFYWNKHRQAQMRQANSCQLINKYSVPVNCHALFNSRTYSVGESGCWPFLSRCNWLTQIKDNRWPRRIPWSRSIGMTWYYV